MPLALGIRLLGVLAVLLLVGACGQDDPDAQDAQDARDAGDPAASATSASERPVLVHATAAGGDPATALTRLPDDQALAAYAAQFHGPLVEQVTRAAARVDVGEGEVLAAQVVAIGCDVPPGARLVGEALVAEKVASPLRECLAPVTTVALAAVPGEGADQPAGGR